MAVKPKVVQKQIKTENVSGMTQAQKVILTILVLAVVAFGGAAYYFYSQLNQVKQDPQKAAQEETKELVAKVSKLIVLPEGEEPTVATVTDPEKLKDQPFFANAKVGDKVLIYSNAKKAVLYDPVSNRIVEVAPITIGATPQVVAPSPQPPTTAE